MAKYDTLKTHRYSLLQQEWGLDKMPPKTVRKSIRKERQEGRKIIRQELKELE